MKTRNDFVSNSSSCSFVVALAAGVPFDDFVEQAARGCLAHADTDDANFCHRQDRLNRAVLNYHLVASELLFLGSLKLEGVVREIRRQDDPDGFAWAKSCAAKGCAYGVEEVLSDGEDAVTLKFSDSASEIAVGSTKMPCVTGVYRFAKDDYGPDPAKQKVAAERIAEFAKAYSEHSGINYLAKANSSTYFISRDTVWNTRALIAAGKKLELDKWMDLDRLDEALKNGTRIFRIRVNNGGDGVDEDALYTFGGWDGEDLFAGVSGADVIGSETM